MKPPHYLISICLLLHVLIHIEGQTKISGCGRLFAKHLTPLLAHGFSSNHHWPWHAAIYHQIGKSDSTYQCGGTVITTRSVLTAAHCVFGNNVLDVEIVTVSLGRLNLARNESSAQWFRVSEILVHPEYNSTNFANDIAIIRLSAHAIFNYYVQPICLWKLDKTDLSEVKSRTGTVIGWGKTENGAVSNVLQEAQFPVADFRTCLKSDPHFFVDILDILTETNFCAGSRNGTALCQGDSGGSIAFEENGIYYIRGIVSVGQRKRNPITQELECDLMQYAVFTDVAKFLPWIIENIRVEREPTSPISRAVENLEVSRNIGKVKNRIIQQMKAANCRECGNRFLRLWTTFSRATPLITNSYNARHWPWHAAIYIVDDSEPEYQCGGTVISSKAILTAAHCVQIDANKISVYLGRLNLGVNENSAQTFRVAEVIAHSEYDKEFNHNDIAIMKLSSDAIFNRYVRPVCLWKSSDTDLSEIVGKSGTIVGWGTTETGEVTTVLREATAPVTSVFDCLQSNRYIIGYYLTETIFCAGHRNGTSVCSGDAGGSMTFEQNGIYYIRGIVSFGPSRLDKEIQRIVCDHPMQYFVLTDVAKYLQWIKDNQ